MRILILWESTHFSWSSSNIELHNLVDEESVCNTVWEVVECTKLMSHWVTNTKECVCKCHTCHCWSISHFFSCNRIISTVLICWWEILKDIFKSLKSKTVCIISSHYRSISLKSMSHSVNTWCRCKTLRLIHHHISINNSDIRKEFVISKRILCTWFFISNNSKRSYLRTCTWRCRNSNKCSLFAHLRECVNSLSDINETHSHIHEVSFRMLIKNPHNFTCVHSWTAAESNNAVRTESSHSLCTFHCRSKSRVRSNIKECSMLNAHFIKLISNALCITILIEELVCNDKCLLFAHNSFQFIKSYRQTTFLKVNLLRCSEPKHIFSPLSYSLNVKQMLDTNVFRNWVAAPWAAAKCKWRCKVEVIKVTDTAVWRWSINENTTCFHSCSKCVNLFFFSYCINIEWRCMTVTAVLNKSVSLFNSIAEIISLIHSKYRRKLFVSKFFTEVNRSNFTDEDFCIFRNIYTCKFCDSVCRLTNDFGI